MKHSKRIMRFKKDISGFKAQRCKRERR